MGVDTLMRRAVFLDRDGVLNRAYERGGITYPPANVGEVELLPGAVEALQLLAGQDVLLVVVTNQPDVARGTQQRRIVETINAYLAERLPLHAVFACYHDTVDNCDCRKPKPGLLLQAARHYDIDLNQSFLVGDRWSDIVAGDVAGCRTFLVATPYSQRERCAPDYEVTDVLEAAHAIVMLLRMQEGELSMPDLTTLRIKIFADGADKAGMLEMARKPFIAGLTTNPTLMRQAGVRDYRAFAKDILDAIPDLPISFEVFSDELAEMERQAHEIASWGQNVYVKIPVSNTRGESTYVLVQRLAKSGVKQNVTALMTLEQVREVAAALADGPSSYVSVFAGRIADTGRDPIPLMAAAVELLRPFAHEELIWASPRELLNIFQADQIGCQIITATNDILKKLNLVGKDLREFSLDTVKMFHHDAKQAGYSL
jgi:transaldolase